MTSNESRHWLFQANAKYFDLATELRGKDAGYTDSWTVSGYRHEMHAGDTVVIWQSGPDGGIWATGTLIGEPYEHIEDLTAEEVESQPYRKANRRVDFRYDRILSNPIPRMVVQEHSVLSGLAIFKFANATNFPVTDEQWNVVQDLMLKSDSSSIGSVTTLHGDNPLQKTLRKILLLRDKAMLNELNAAFEILEQIIKGSWPMVNRHSQVDTHLVPLTWWVGIPWLAIVSSKWRTIDTGVFVRYLVRSDRSGVYLTLSHGRAARARNRGTRLTNADLQQIRDYIGFLAEFGFSFDRGIDLRSNYAPVDSRYARPAIAWKFYPADAVPGDAELLRDMDAALRAFEGAHEVIDAVPVNKADEVLINVDLRETLQAELQRRGIYFSDVQAATFSSALQTKGFVILSGISGTGKTKLVQHTASMLPGPRPTAVASEETIVLAVKPYMHQHRRIAIPKRFHEFLGLSALPNPSSLTVVVGDNKASGKLYHALTDIGATSYLTLQEPVGTVFEHWFKLGERFVLEPVVDSDQVLSGFTVRRELDALTPDSPNALMIEYSNHLFLSVRPDWRDSKALLGYYNPLTEAYEWTPFLRFLERARRSYEQGDGLAWFVVLDEMNLAHVEYYFADMLSVMESGRDEQGWTNEALLLVYPETAEGDLPPREMRLPPNLYVVGTVNIDETTHAFSPKVLDRAFSIELVDVDFSDYPPTPGEEPELSDAERQALLAAFTRNGRFPRIDKAEIAAYVADHPEVRDRLQSLNARLRRDNLHFGYRVFDEIVTFLAVADENAMFDDLGESAAFDAAVLMKVLPKFHGSRGKLQRPLEALLAWCLSPDDPNPILPLPQPGGDVDPLATYRSLPYALPKTAERVLRMLDELQTDGFTAFG